MKRIVVAVGCDRYDHLGRLYGAERDAIAFHEQLASPKGDYDASSAVLLLSPTLGEIIAALSELPFGIGGIDTLTIFFAGHGGDKSGTYYICARDTDPQRMSTTGLAISRLLSAIAELKPRQANVIIDACQSGGAMLDSAGLLRSDALGLGSPASLSIGFLAACGPHEYANETVDGGQLTQAVLTYIRGGATLQTTRPSLDLIDLGRRVSSELSEKLPDQMPVSWGINLTGEGRFVPNPHFAPATEDLAKAAAVLSMGSLNDASRRAVQSQAFALWSRHREVEEEVDVAALRRTLNSLVVDLGSDKTGIAQLLRGLSTSLRASAVKSPDLFGEAMVLFACAEPLLGQLDDTLAFQVATQLLDEAVSALSKARHWLMKELETNRFCLLTDGNGIADLYYLPLRLSRILGWLAAGLEIERLLERQNAQAEGEVKEIAERFLEHYAPSLTARSDAQAPYVLTFVEIARDRGWNTAAEQVAGCYFNGFVESQGVIARPDLPADETFRFVLELGAGPEHVEHRRRANPTQFSAVLLALGASLQMDKEWNSELIILDHHSGYVFVPDTYGDYGLTVIEKGTNIGFQMGLDVFTVDDFRSLLRTQVVAAVEKAKTDMSPLAASLALVASCLQPDRLPFHVVDTGAILGSIPATTG